MELILHIFKNFGVVFVWVVCALQWRKKYHELKSDYDNLLKEISRLSEENRNLKRSVNTDPVE